MSPGRVAMDTITHGGSLGDAARGAARVGLLKFMNKNSNVTETTHIDLDGTLFEINTSIADKFINVYNSLNEENQSKMVDMMSNPDSQQKIYDFVTRY